MLAMALQALWPLIAQAKPRSSTLAPICTVDGVTHYFELKKRDTPLEQRSAAHEHCAFCTFGAAALPSVRQASLENPSLDFENAPTVLQSSASRSFPAARPRAPPSIS